MRRIPKAPPQWEPSIGRTGCDRERSHRRSTDLWQRPRLYKDVVAGLYHWTAHADTGSAATCSTAADQATDYESAVADAASAAADERDSPAGDVVTTGSPPAPPPPQLPQMQAGAPPTLAAQAPPPQTEAPPLPPMKSRHVGAGRFRHCRRSRRSATPTSNAVTEGARRQRSAAFPYRTRRRRSVPPLQRRRPCRARRRRSAAVQDGTRSRWSAAVPD
jgi:hypothetical protein